MVTRLRSAVASCRCATFSARDWENDGPRFVYRGCAERKASGFPLGPGIVLDHQKKPSIFLRLGTPLGIPLGAHLHM